MWYYPQRSTRHLVYSQRWPMLLQSQRLLTTLKGTEYSNLVQSNSKLPMIELAGAPLPTITERLITPVSKPHFKPQRTLLSTREDLELMHKRFGHTYQHRIHS